MKTVISDLQGVVMTNGAGLSGTFVENSLTVAGNVGFGAAGLGAGKAIVTITLTAGGTGYTNGNYQEHALTGGAGTGATAGFIVAAGIVTFCGLRYCGSGYLAGDVLSCATIGAGAGLIVTVSTVGSSVASDGIVAAPRIGAGTNNPTASFEAANAAIINGFARFLPASSYSSGAVTLSQSFQMLQLGTRATDYDLSSVGTGFFYPINISPVLTNLACNFTGIQVRPIPMSTSGTIQLSGYISVVARGFASDLATASHIGFNDLFVCSLVAGSAASYSHSNVFGANIALNFASPGTTSEASGFRSTVLGNSTQTITNAHSFYQVAATFSGGTTVTNFYGMRLGAITVTAPSTITNAYGLRVEAFEGTGTVTNRYPIAQEDTLGTSFFRAKTAFGPSVGTAPGDALASLEVATNGTTNGNIRLNTANAVIDVSAGSTNGVKFNNPGTAGITGVTLANYQEGTFTVTDGSGAGLVITQNMVARYTRVGRNVTVICDITYPANANGLGAQILLPIPVNAVTYGGGAICWNDTAAARFGLVHDTVCRFYVQGVTAQSTNAALSGVQLIVTMTYTLA